MRAESVIKYIDKKIKGYFETDMISIDAGINKLIDLKDKFENKSNAICSNYYQMLCDYIQKRIDDLQYMKVLCAKTSIYSNSKLFELVILKEKLVQKKYELV